LFCDGSLVSRTTYALLYSVIGDTFGAGDGSTTFKLPSFRDRMPIGAGATYSANTTGGSADAVVVSHSHSATSTSTVTDPGHSHTAARYGGGSSTGVGNVDNDNLTVTSTNTTGITVATSTAVATAGVSGTNANLPPYIGIHFIIRTGL